MKDKQGRKYAKLSALKRGNEVVVDGDFDCLEPWSKRRVVETSDGALSLECSSGNHRLDGQLSDDGDSLIGVYPV